MYWQNDKHIIEQRYFINSIQADADIFAKAVRGHWGIENKLHWTLDVTFREDANRIRKGFAPAIMTTIRHICINLFQKSNKKGSARRKLFKSALDDDFRASMLFG